MTGGAASFGNGVAWEITRLRRSRRGWLLAIPAVAAPIGSVLADVYLNVPSAGTAALLGLLVAAGLGALVVLDLTALSVGEELALRTHLLLFALPEERGAVLGGRLFVVLGGSLGAFALGGGAAAWLASSFVRTEPGAPLPILPAVPLYLGLFALLLFLGAVAAAASVITRSAAQGLVAGILAGVVAAGVASFLLLQHELDRLFPVAVALVGVAGLGLAIGLYARSEV